MSDLALYRRYRPSKFSEVIGQEAAINTLAGSLKLGRTSHAYLLAGPRGTGKTSVARILARELGAEPPDINEIDAASHRGIDEIRALRDAVLTLPFVSPVKVYIVDEVHMLTREAFNALLKTLEEPPSHVVFILATTEINKVPDTIVSRCQTLNFKKPALVDVKKTIEHIAKKEGWKLDAGVADLIALLGDGSFRDAIGELQRVMGASPDKKITLAEVEKVSGAPAGGLALDIVTATVKQDLPAALAAVRALENQSGDVKLFTKMILRLGRFLLLGRLAPAIQEELATEMSPDEVKALRALQTEAGMSVMPTALRELLTAHEEIAHAHIATLPLELALMRIISQDK
ncbi:MAG: DNA polymerase III subunit gamma/tau [Patescibacteria group bacterium]